MEVTAELSGRQMLERCSDATDSKEQTQRVWMVPASLCAMRHIHDQQYLSGVEGSIRTRLLRPKADSEELRSASLKSRKDCGKQKTLQMGTLKNIRVVEKLFLNYNSK